MEPVNILDARNNLSKLVSQAERGDDVVISKRGKPLVRLVPVAEDRSLHTAGQAAAWLTTHHAPVADSRTIDELDEQIAREREGWE